MATTLERSTRNPLPVAILFAAILLLGIVGLTRYAHGWVELASDAGSAAVLMGADGVIGVVSAAVTAVGAVWLYIVHLVR